MTRKTEKKRTTRAKVAPVADVAVSEVQLAAAEPQLIEVPPADGTSDPEARIAILAYLMAERRGFTPGFELDDWLAAEAEYRGR